jgi:hypothetical protein
MASKRKLDDSEILSLLKDGVAAGVKFNDTKLSRERKRVMDYYNGTLPAPVHKGNSPYVSTDVFDCVEWAKSVLLETFSAHADIVTFSPKHDDPKEIAEADIATAYCKHVIFEQNGGTETFGTVFHDGLTARNAITKVYWDDRTEKVGETFSNLTEDSLAVLLQDDDVELEELTQEDSDTDDYSGQPAPPSFSGSLTRNSRKSQVRIEVIPPEEFVVSPNIKCLDEAPILTHRTEKSKSDLLKEGYPKAKVKLLVNGDDELRLDSERITRFTAVSDSFGRDEDRQETTKLFVVYESFARLDLDGSGETSLWRIVHSGNVILEKEVVERHPFLSFSPLPIPHSFYGGNFASKAIPIQNAKTVLSRSILDHAVLANNPRFGVVKGALTNPRELLDNRIGGLVNVSRPDGIFPLPQAPLNPFVFQTIEMLDSDKEDVTGVSRLSQGLNKDAISSQNSQGMVEQLINSSMQRQKTIARAFAQQFLRPLYLEVYRLVIENEDRECIVQVAGNFIPVKPSDWVKQRDVSMDLRLGYGEKDQLAAEYLQFGQLLATDQIVAPLFGIEQRRALYKSVMEMKGHKNVSQFLRPVTPQDLNPAPDPMAVAQLDKLKAETASLTQREQRATEEAAHKAQLDQLKEDFDQRFQTLEFMLKQRDEDRKDDETSNRIEISQREMDLAEKAQESTPAPNEKTSAIISPNG